MASKKKIGDFFKEGLEKSDFEPRNDLWIEINKTLQKRKKRRFFWYYFGLLAFIFLLIPSIYLSVSPYNDPEGSRTDKKNIPLESRKVFKEGTIGHETINQKQNGIEGTIPQKSQEYPNSSNFFAVSKNYIEETVPSGLNEKHIDEPFNDTQRKLVTTIQGNGKRQLDSVTSNVKDTLLDSTKIRRPKRKATSKEPEILKKDSLTKWIVTLQGGVSTSSYLTKQNPLLPQMISKSGNFVVSPSLRILFKTPVNENIAIRFGIGHQEFRYNATYIPQSSNSNSFGGLLTSNIDPPINPVSNDLANTVEIGDPITVDHRIRYLQLPIECVFKLNSNKITPYVTSGIDFFILQDDDITLSTTNSNDFKVGSASYLSRLSLAAHLGAGIEYPIANSIYIQLEPTFTYQLGGYRNGIEHPYPYYFNVYSGISIKF